MEMKEWSSQRVGGVADHVAISDENGLAGTYFIGVYGYAFSTYQLIVKVIRDTDLDISNYPVLFEGYSQKSRI